VFRVAIWVVPAAVAILTYRLCLGLLERERIEHDRELAKQEARLTT
jgi:hypothetical protein